MAEKFDYEIEIQPMYARHDMLSSKKGLLSNIKAARRKIATFIEKRFGIDLLRIGAAKMRKITKTNFLSYDDIWQTILSSKPVRKNSIPGAFVGWDNTPRYGENAQIIRGETPEKFEKYMTAQIKKAKEDYSTDLMFIYAWNEWAEGGYLEPDEEYGNAYLEAIRNALKANDEFPW